MIGFRLMVSLAKSEYLLIDVEQKLSLFSDHNIKFDCEEIFLTKRSEDGE